ncbi:MAG: HEAT repeat domain-containing protein [Gemmatales bacterium]
MGFGKQTLVAKCPACQATTKVNVHPDKLSIRCPRCQATVPLAFARKFDGEKKTAQEMDYEHKAVRREAPSTVYGSELGDTNQPTFVRSKSKKENRGPRGSTEFSYPDHQKPFVRYAYIAVSVVALLSLVAGIYLYWTNLQNLRNQDYVKNVRDAIEQHQVAVKSLRKFLDPAESTDARKAFREATAQINVLALFRKKMYQPKPEDVEGLPVLLEELAKAEKELTIAEEEVKKLASQTSVKELKPVPARVDPAVVFSTTQGVKTSDKEPVRAIPEAVDNKTVIIKIPDISKSQWSDEFVKRFAMLADDGDGKVEVKWSGDLLLLMVTPVVDPARYATKINFATLIYLSSNDRTITIGFKPERVNNYNAEGDYITPLLIDLKQRDKLNKLLPALTQLASQKVDPGRRAEVSAVLEVIAGEVKLEATVREQAIKLLPNWSGRESASLLVRLLDDPTAVIRLHAVDALALSRSPKSAAILAEKWEKLDPDRVAKALISMGSDVEPVVLPYLNNTKNLTVRIEVCRVLKEVGTELSLKPLLDVINDKSTPAAVANSARDAMKAVLDRKPN